MTDYTTLIANAYALGDDVAHTLASSLQHGISYDNFSDELNDYYEDDVEKLDIEEGEFMTDDELDLVGRKDAWAAHDLYYAHMTENVDNAERIQTLLASAIEKRLAWLQSMED